MKLPSWWFMPLLAVLTACSSTQSIRNGDPSSAALNAFFEDYFQESLRLDPLAATFIGDHR
jgi:hypothetical protein